MTSETEIKQMREQLEYWKADSAAAWDKCAELRGTRLAEAQDLLREALDQIDCSTGDRVLDAERKDLRARIHAVLASI